jgi:hypothetical protein
MDITKKNISLIIMVGFLLYGLPVVTLCSSYCVSKHLDLDSTVDGSCPFTYHSFVQIAIVLSILFISPLAAGFLLSGDRQFIPHGAFWPLFRPPRFFR